MAAAYSIDLRERVLAEYDKRVLKKGALAKLFKISPKTLYNWVKRREQTGEAEPKTGYQKGPGQKITDMEKFKEFVSRNPNCSFKELSRRWGTVSRTTIGRMLHKIGMTFKKNVRLQRAQ